MAQGVFQSSQDAVEIEDVRLEDLFAPVGQKLTGQGSRPVGRLMDFGGVSAQRMAGGRS